MIKKLIVLLSVIYTTSVQAQVYYYENPYANYPRLIIPQNQPVQTLATPSYEELARWPADCSRRTEQLTALRNIQRIKNFDPDPDRLNESDRNYNSRLKAIIWWYPLYCSK